MSTVLSDGATTSATVLGASKFRLLRNLSKIFGESRFLSFNNIRGPQAATSTPSQNTEDIDIPSPQAEGLSSNPRISPTVRNELPVTEPYNTAVRIPRLRKTAYVFPGASSRIRQAHKNRYPVLKGIFQRNIENDPGLLAYTAHISYELRMCGSCEVDATESILIFCPSKKVLKKIKKLLTQPHIRSQFEPEIETATSVRFSLFFWDRAIEMLAFHEIAVIIPEEPVSRDSMAHAVIGHVPWGLQILEGGYGERYTAAMGCIVQVGGEQFGLTAAHAFNNPPATFPKNHDVGASDSDTDDEEYDMRMGEEEQASIIMMPVPSTDGRGRTRTVQLGKCQVHTAPLLEDASAWMKEHANLDWALLEMGSNGDRLPTYTSEIEALKIVECLPQECTDVLVITPTLPGVPATLYNIPSYIGGEKGSPAAEVWTLGCLSKGNPIRKGDSGSIVVDARSGELYGMVVAANPFGDIHITPLATVLSQVKELFKNEDAYVLKAPRYLDCATFGPSRQVNSLSKNQEASDVNVGEYADLVEWECTLPSLTCEESLSGTGTLLTHQPNVGTFEWANPCAQASSSLVKKRTTPETKAGMANPRPKPTPFLPNLGRQESATLGSDSERVPPFPASPGTPSSSAKPLEIGTKVDTQSGETSHGTNLEWPSSAHTLAKAEGRHVDYDIYTRGDANEAEIIRTLAESISPERTVPVYDLASPQGPVLPAGWAAVSKDSVLREAVAEGVYDHEETDLTFYDAEQQTDNVFELAEFLERRHADAREGNSGAHHEPRFPRMPRIYDVPRPRCTPYTSRHYVSTIDWVSIVTVIVLLIASLIGSIIKEDGYLHPQKRIVHPYMSLTVYG